jgi:hypothetical protein
MGDRTPIGVITPCKAKEATIGVWLRKTDGTTPIPGAVVTLNGPTPGIGTTDADGFAFFKGRSPGDYTLAVDLARTASAKFQVQPYAQAVSVASGQTLIRSVMARPVSTLSVLVIDDRTSPKLVPDVWITISGPETHEALSARGSHKFVDIAAGIYRITARSGLARYAAYAEAVEVHVPEGTFKAARLVLPLINQVFPTIDAAQPKDHRDEREILFLPKELRSPPSLVANTKARPLPLAPDDTLEITLGCYQNFTDKPFVGNGTLTWDQALVSVYSDATAKVALQPGQQFSAASLLAGQKVWVKAQVAGSAQFMLSLGGHPDRYIELNAPANLAVIQREFNLVSATLQVETKVVLYDRKLAALELTSEGKKIRPQATWVDVSVRQSSGVPRFSKGAVLSAPNVDVYTDEKCEPLSKLDLSKPIPNEKLLGPGPLRLWLIGKTKGKFDLTLTLENPGDSRIIRKPTAPVQMGVVELASDVYYYDETSFPPLEGFLGPVEDYYKKLEKLDLSVAMKPLGWTERIREGRLLHMQAWMNYGRAKLVLQKLDASQWPEGTDDYEIGFSTMGLGADTISPAELKIFDREVDGEEVTESVKVAELKLKDRVYWVEGSEVSKAHRDVALDVGVHCGAVFKKHGDWIRFTVVKITKVAFQARSEPGFPKVWDRNSNRYFVNVDANARDLRTQPGQRAVLVYATVDPPLAGIKVHFMLAGEGAHRAKDSPGLAPGWDWGKLDLALREKDRETATDFLHVSSVTGAEGISGHEGTAINQELRLSRFGGDKFRIGAYLTQDAHLAKYIAGHDKLEARAPALSDPAHPIEIWRKVFAQITRNKKTNLPVRDKVKSLFERSFIEYQEVTEVAYDESQVPGLIEHPRWQFHPDGGDEPVVNVGPHNIGKFKKLFNAPTAETTPKLHLIISDEQWDPGESRLEVIELTSRRMSYKFVNQSGNESVAIVEPSLDGRPLVAPGSVWSWTDKKGTDHEWQVTSKDIKILETRKDYSEVSFSLPLRCGNDCLCGKKSLIIVGPKAPAWLGISMACAEGPFLGLSGKPTARDCLINISDEEVLKLTIAHELGHMLNMVRVDNAGGDPSIARDPYYGVPKHSNFYVKRGGQGRHCSHGATLSTTKRDEDGNAAYRGNGTCVMFGVVGSQKDFCARCHTDLLAQDIEDFFK